MRSIPVLQTRSLADVVITGIDILNAYVPVPGHANAYPIQSTTEKIKTMIHFKGLSRNDDKNRSRSKPKAAVSSENTAPEAAPLRDACGNNEGQRNGTY
jgi:hypothetical protein